MNLFEPGKGSFKMPCGVCIFRDTPPDSCKPCQWYQNEDVALTTEWVALWRKVRDVCSDPQ